jgi:Mrp family chromosome partitioning ATPase
VGSAAIQRRARDQISNDLLAACPGYSDFVSVIRRFAGSRFASASHEVIGVIGAQPGEGKTTVSLILATALAELHQRVVYVEADGTEPESILHELAEPEYAGLGDWLASRASLSDVLYATARPNLYTVPIGQTKTSLSTLQTLAPLNTLLTTLRSGFDVVLIDMPPLLRDEAGPALLRQLDCAVIVAAANETNLEDVDRVVQLCENLPVAGILLNKLSNHAPGWLRGILSPAGKREAS